MLFRRTIRQVPLAVTLPLALLAMSGCGGTAPSNAELASTGAPSSTINVSTTPPTPPRTRPPSPSTTPSTSTATIAATSTAPIEAPSTAPPTVPIAPTPAPGAMFAMVDGAATFSIVVDEAAATVRFVAERARADGSIDRREASQPWSAEPNRSGHTQTGDLAPPLDLGADVVEANRTLVGDYLQTALRDGRWEDADRFFRDGQYILHGPLFDDGFESVRSFFIDLRDAGAPFTYESTPILLADGNYVLAVSQHRSDDGSTAYWDLWRLEDGAIVEHWDVVQPVPDDQVAAYFAWI